jgi:hypothetical protein
MDNNSLKKRKETYLRIFHGAQILLQGELEFLAP